MMTLTQRAAVCALFSAAALAGSVAFGQSPKLFRTILANGEVQLPGLSFMPPANWRLEQDAISGDTLILGFSKGDDSVTVYATQKTGLSMRSIFMNDVKMLHYVQSEQHGPFAWQALLTSKTSRRPDGSHRTYYMSSFQIEREGVTYYGYSRSESQASATAEANSFLDGMKAPVRRWSLTSADYTGKKYYIGFGDRLSGFMGNEVKYDIAHTHDIFTEGWGGDYIGQTLLGQGGRAILDAFRQVREKMTGNDMYVQYSSGHGSPQGLMAGVSYDQIRDNALAMPAKEVIIFTMACYSGNLIESFNRRKSDWQGWRDQGRNLMVLASSQPDEESQTGPGTDPDQPNSPYGSAGSAFGHALWKALIGYADGYVDGVKDGFISLLEIREYTGDTVRHFTQGAQNPTLTGAFYPSLVMNRVPPEAYLTNLVGKSTEGMSDAKVMELIQKLDHELAVQ